MALASNSKRKGGCYSDSAFILLQRFGASPLPVVISPLLLSHTHYYSPVQVKNSVSVYIDRDSDRDRDKKKHREIFQYFGTIDKDRDRVRNRDATKP